MTNVKFDLAINNSATASAIKCKQSIKFDGLIRRALKLANSNLANWFLIYEWIVIATKLRSFWRNEY
jgi:hypothetical protein